MWWYLVLAAVGGILYWQLVWLPAKSAGSTHAPATAPTATGAPAVVPGAGAPLTRRQKFMKWAKSSFWVIVLVAIGVLIIGEIVTKAIPTPTPDEIGTWGKELWLWILVLWGVAAGLIAMLAPNAAAKTLQWIAAAVAIATIAIFPLWSWIESRSTTEQPTDVGAVPRAENKPQAEWLQLTIPPKARSKFLPRPGGMHHRWACQQCELVSIYPDGSECSSRAGETSSCAAGSTGSYIQNLSDRENAVSVAIARD